MQDKAENGRITMREAFGKWTVRMESIWNSCTPMPNGKPWHYSGFTNEQLIKVTYNICHLQRTKTIHSILLLFPQHGATLYPVRLNSGIQAILSSRKRTRFSTFHKGNLPLECTTKAQEQSKIFPTSTNKCKYNKKTNRKIQFMTSTKPTRN